MAKYLPIRNFRWLVVVLVVFAATMAFAREPLSIDQGKSGLLLTLRKLRTTGRLMHTAAHPDDEDGGMLTLESRGRGTMAVQMTLTRGEGGQNAVGNEFGDELGMLRTLELLEADRYYGVDQRFSRVADFGFSKTAEETLQKWDAKNTALPDLVRVIRTYRPDVVISRFVGDPSDGHGNHQASGLLTREAFRDAGDPTKFPEQIEEGLEPWQPKKLYVRAKGDDWNVELDVNQVDPVLGMSYVAWAWQGLKHQLSQGSANWQMPTRMWTSHYKLADTTIPNYHPGHEKDFFDGIDTSLPGLADVYPRAAYLKTGLLELQSSIDEAAGLVDKDMQAAAVPLLRGMAKTEELIAEVKKSDMPAETKAELLLQLETKRNQFRDAANFALKLTLKADAQLPAMKEISDPKSKIWLAAYPGETIQIAATAFTYNLTIDEVHLLHPPGSTVSQPLHFVASAANLFTSTVTVAPDARYTRQYWHRDDPDRDAIYKIDDPQYATLPLTPPPFHVVGTYTYKGLKGEIESEVDVEQPREHPLIIGPQWSVLVPQSTLVIPAASEVTGETTVTMKSNAAGNEVLPRISVNGNGVSQLSPETREHLDPPVVPANPVVRPVSFAVSDHQHQFRVQVFAQSLHSRFDSGYSVVDREDLGTAYYFRRASQPVSIVDVSVPKNMNIGYIMGAGDDIPEVLRSLGINVTLITPEELKSGDLSKYTTIVTGIRAYEARPDLRENNQRLLDYVKNGGTFMVQYIYRADQFNDGHFAPYPITLTRDNVHRVTVEEAPVDILAPANPVFHTPNQITQKDFDGWVQERVLYCATSWDSQYQPLLSSADPGDEAEKGGLLEAKYGKGTYIFNSWAFFRQLPAGVPGAIRLYINLLNAGQK